MNREYTEVSGSASVSDDTTVEVDISTLAGLGTIMLREAETVRMNAAGVLYPMNDTVPNFAGGGLAEGANFEFAHQQAQAKLTQFLNDVVNGLTTLGNAALAISAEYGDSDAYGAATVESVRGAFPPAATDPQSGV
jgi:hypothetical protein